MKSKKTQTGEVISLVEKLETWHESYYDNYTGLSVKVSNHGRISFSAPDGLIARLEFTESMAMLQNSMAKLEELMGVKQPRKNK